VGVDSRVPCGGESRDFRRARWGGIVGGQLGGEEEGELGGRGGDRGAGANWANSSRARARVLGVLRGDRCVSGFRRSHCRPSFFL
jgi:hypothetical protein